MDYSGIVYENGHTMLHGITNFDLEETLDCGQSFRWERSDEGAYTGIAFDRRLCVEREGDRLILRDTTSTEFESIWRDYFDLSRDYGKIKKLFQRDAVLAQATSFAGGIRVLKQEGWETLCTFILSQNNNIPRIKGLVKRLCENFGDKIDGGHTFPAAKRLAGLTVEDIAPVRAGFRAKYLIDAARKVSFGEVSLDSLYDAPLEAARAELMKIHGVGPKVAECALLYGFGRVACFPLDVWMRRVMIRYYPDGFPQEFEAVAGIAQQYLFHYIRRGQGMA